MTQLLVKQLSLTITIDRWYECPLHGGGHRVTYRDDGLVRTWPATLRAITLIILILLPFAVLVGGTLLYALLGKFGGLQQELAIVYFIGLIVLSLLVGLKITALLFSHVGIADKNGAMGLPQGSIRAILALGLVLIFAVMAMGLFSQVHQAGRIVTSVGLTQVQLDAIPPAQIAGLRSRVEGDATVFDVDRRVPGSDTADDIAKQLVTILGTLVVAVSAFYFGAQSVQAAQTAVGARRRGGSSPGGSVAIDSPKPGVPLKPDGAGYAAYPVVVTTEPPGLAVTAHIIGDDGGLVSETVLGSGKFEYKPKHPGDEVLLRFALAGTPGTSADLIVSNPGAVVVDPVTGKPTSPQSTPTPPRAPTETPIDRGEQGDGEGVETEVVDEETSVEAAEPAVADLEAEPALGAGGGEPTLGAEEAREFRPTPERSTPAEAYDEEEDNLPRPG
jgi:hypothetical protein